MGRLAWLQEPFVVVLVASSLIALSGCATKPAYVPPAIADATIHVEGHIPAGGLPNPPRISVDEKAAQLSGFPSPEERSQFEKERSAKQKERSEQIDKQVDDRMRGFLSGGGFNPVREPHVLLCVIPPVFVACAAAAGGVYAIGRGVERGIASGQIPEIPDSVIPEREASRLAATFKERITGANLGERTLKLAPLHAVSAVKEPPTRLVVGVRSGYIEYLQPEWVRIWIIAQGQAFPADGPPWQPTAHMYGSPSRSLADWTKNGDELVRREIDIALELLAQDILARYRPGSYAIPTTTAFSTPSGVVASPYRTEDRFVLVASGQVEHGDAVPSGELHVAMNTIALGEGNQKRASLVINFAAASAEGGRSLVAQTAISCDTGAASIHHSFTYGAANGDGPLVKAEEHTSPKVLDEPSAALSSAVRTVCEAGPWWNTPAHLYAK